ncbi:MAG: hypothetical protein SNJ82_13335 [Gemmataceae bacterium]
MMPELSPIASEPLSLVLLATPETAREENVRPWLDWLQARDGVSELILVVDGPLAAEQQLPNHARLRVQSHDQAEGEGRALRRGLLATRHPLVAYAPCDAEYKPEHVQALLDRRVPAESLLGTPYERQTELREIDLVHLLSGYRAGLPMPLLPRLFGALWRGFCLVVFNYPPVRLPGWLGLRRHLAWLGLRFVFALRYHDPLCPVRLFRREILHRLPLQSRTAFVHVELLAKANFLGKIFGAEQVPLNVVPPRYRGDAGAMWRDMKRVMNSPDFGPAVVPPDAILPDSPDAPTGAEKPAPAT